MEITDIFIVNKMDLHGADKKVADIMQMLEFKNSYKYESEILSDNFAKLKQWTPEITKVNSLTGENFDILLGLIKNHKLFLEESGVISNYMKNRVKSETIQILKHKLTRKVEELLNSDAEIGKYIDQVMQKSLDPYSMANLIIKMLGLDK